MIKHILIILMLCCISSEVFAAPSIETYSNGVITGSGFGTKTTAAPYKFETFEDGMLGNSVVGSSDFWIPSVIPASVDGTAYSNEVQRTPDSTLCYKQTFTSTATDSREYCIAHETTAFDTSGKLFADFWFRMDLVTLTGSAPQLKIFAFQQNDQMVDGSLLKAHATVPLIGCNMFANMIGLYLYYGNGGDTTTSATNLNEEDNRPPVLTNDEWMHFTVQAKKSTNSTTNDGYLKIIYTRDGVVNTDIWANEINVDSVDEFIQFLKFGYLVVGSDTSLEAYSFYDDIYIDNSWARVEIGDDPVYANCTHREIQPAATWSDTEITGNLNIGSFAADATVYFFVVDEDGVASAGYEVTLSGSPTYDTPTITGPDDFSTTESSVEITGPYTVDPDLPDQSVIATWTLGEASGFCVAALGVFSCTVPVELGANSVVFRFVDSIEGEDSDTTVVTRTPPPSSGNVIYTGSMSGGSYR